jgi:hypothetical protein
MDPGPSSFLVIPAQAGIHLDPAFSQVTSKIFPLVRMSTQTFGAPRSSPPLQACPELVEGGGLGGDGVAAPGESIALQRDVKRMQGQGRCRAEEFHSSSGGAFCAVWRSGERML